MKQLKDVVRPQTRTRSVRLENKHGSKMCENDSTTHGWSSGKLPDAEAIIFESYSTTEGDGFPFYTLFASFCTLWLCLGNAVMYPTGWALLL